MLGSHPPKSSLIASRHARPITFFILAILYTCKSLACLVRTLISHDALWPSSPLLTFHNLAVAHTMVLFVQMVTLNVAVNSYSNALLTLLISNQFVEIKGSVFKKFEKENLFQLSCSGKVALAAVISLASYIRIETHNLIILHPSTRYRREISVVSVRGHHHYPKPCRTLSITPFSLLGLPPIICATLLFYDGCRSPLDAMPLGSGVRDSCRLAEACLYHQV